MYSSNDAMIKIGQKPIQQYSKYMKVYFSVIVLL